MVKQAADTFVVQLNDTGPDQTRPSAIGWNDILPYRANHSEHWLNVYRRAAGVDIIKLSRVEWAIKYSMSILRKVTKGD